MLVSKFQFQAQQRETRSGPPTGRPVRRYSLIGTRPVFQHLISWDWSVTGIHLIFQENQMGTTQDPQIWSHRGRFDAFFSSVIFWVEKKRRSCKERSDVIFLCRWHGKTLENNWMNIAHYKQSKHIIQRWRWLKMVALFSITSDVFASLSYMIFVPGMVWNLS